MTYEISYTDGRRAEEHDTLSAAVESIESDYPEWYAVDESGWEVDGAVFPGGERVLVWADESDSEDDDGARAVASIREQ